LKKKFELIEIKSPHPQMSFSLLKEKCESHGIEMGIANVDEFNFELCEQADAIKVPIYTSSEIYPNLTSLTLPVQNMGVFDVIFKQEGQIFPRIIMFEAFTEMLAQTKSYLDLRKPAYIVGDQSLARVALGVLTHIGLSRIFIYGTNTSSIEAIVKNYTKQNFSLNIEIHPLSEITQNQEIGGVLVNTEFLKTGSEELELTSYFNFLSSDSLVLDMCNVKELFEEAQRAELKYLNCSDAEVFWTKRVAYWLGLGNIYGD